VLGEVVLSVVLSVVVLSVVVLSVVVLSVVVLVGYGSVSCDVSSGCVQWVCPVGVRCGCFGWGVGEEVQLTCTSASSPSWWQARVGVVPKKPESVTSSTVSPMERTSVAFTKDTTM